MNFPLAPPAPQYPAGPAKNKTLGIIGFTLTACLPAVFFLGLILAWLTSCHDGQPRDVACIPDVAQWAKFLTGFSFFASFITVPTGFIVSIIAIIANRGRAWGWATLALCLIPLAGTIWA